MHPNITISSELLASLGISPAYIVTPSDNLTEAERRCMFGGSERVLAFTSSVCDLLFHKALRYRWQGRGFCCVFKRSPLNMALDEMLGVVVHEAGHYLDYCNRPERDDADRGRAVKAAWDNQQSEAEQHGERWVRATVHLWARAVSSGYEIPAGELNLDNPIYLGNGSTDQYISALLPEAAARRSESIEQIIGSPPPAALAALFNSRHSANRPAPTIPIPAAAATTAQPANGSFVSFIGGRPVESFADGRVRTFDSMDGRQRGKSFGSISDFLSDLSLVGSV